MITLGDFVWGGLLPALTAAATLTIIWKLAHDATLSWVCGVSLGYLVGHWGLDAQNVGLADALLKSIRPSEARDWLPMAVLAAATVEVISTVGPHAARWAWLGRLAVVAMLPWRLLLGSVYLPKTELSFGFETQSWTNIEAAIWLGAAAVLLGGLWVIMKLKPNGTLPRLSASLTTLSTLGATLTIALSGSLTTAQLLGALTATLVGCGVAAALWRLEVGPEGASAPLVVVWGGVLVIARFLLEPELSNLNVILLLLALAAAVGWLGSPRRISTKKEMAIRSAACLVALALCVVPAAKEFAASQQQQPLANPYLTLPQ